MILTIIRNRQKSSYYGMCKSLDYLEETRVITPKEKLYVKRFLFDNMPTLINQYKEFRNSSLWNFPETMGTYWWLTSDIHSMGNQIRIEYLTALIDNNKIRPKYKILNNLIWKIREKLNF